MGKEKKHKEHPKSEIELIARKCPVDSPLFAGPKPLTNELSAMSVSLLWKMKKKR